MTSNKTSIDNLIKQLQDPDIDTKTSAIYELGQAKVKQAIPQLINLINDQDIDLDVRWAATEASGEIALTSPEILSVLITHLKDDDEDLNIRRAAISSLFKIDSSKAITALLEFANDSSRDSFLRSQIKYKVANILEEKIQQQSSFHKLIANYQTKLQNVANSAMDLISNLPTWTVIEPRIFAAQHQGDQEEESNYCLERKISINSRSYILMVKGEENQGESQGEHCYSFTLRAENPAVLIPKGIKLRLLDEQGQDYQDNEIEADSDLSELQMLVAVEPGEGIIWQTIPESDDYNAETLYF